MLLNCVEEMSNEFPTRKMQYDKELGDLDLQIQTLNNLLGRWVMIMGVLMGVLNGT